ncbi:MAG: serine acetyltransferase [Bacteroidales bacterium]|nr:serine acetyltransferase [Bacteroidales bacterium]
MVKIENFCEFLSTRNIKYCKTVPSLTGTQKFVDQLINLLFPIKSDKISTLEEIELRLYDLKNQLRYLLFPVAEDLELSIDEISDKFFDQIPSIYELLNKDIDAFMEFDPAAKSTEEVILCYPGFYSIAIYRMANLLYKMNVPTLPRVISEYAHSKTGIDIHPGATIGEYFFIDHGTGVVIGETTHIGNKVKIYQGVTLGAICVEKALANTKRHPTIEDNVVIYAGTTILGGDTVIGHDTIVGGNVWLTKSVQSHSMVYHESTTVIRNGEDRKPCVDNK